MTNFDHQGVKRVHSSSDLFVASHPCTFLFSFIPLYIKVIFIIEIYMKSKFLNEIHHQSCYLNGIFQHFWGFNRNWLVLKLKISPFATNHFFMEFKYVKIFIFQIKRLKIILQDISDILKPFFSFCATIFN